MPLVQGHLSTGRFWFFRPPNHLALGQADDALTVTASSEAAGAEASPNILHDNSATCYMSDGLGGDIILEWFLGAPKRMDAFVLRNTNLHLADGLRLEIWDAAAGFGSKLFDSDDVYGDAIDPVVRPDPSVLSEHAALNIQDRIAHTPIRMPSPIDAVGLRLTLHTTGGNGSSPNVQICSAFAGLDLAILDSLGGETLTRAKLTPRTMSIGLGSSSTPRPPGAKVSIPLSFLRPEDRAEIFLVESSTLAHYPAFIWTTNRDLLSFDGGAFWGIQPDKGSTNKRLSFEISRTTLDREEVR